MKKKIGIHLLFFVFGKFVHGKFPFRGKFSFKGKFQCEKVGKFGESFGINTQSECFVESVMRFL